MVSGVDRCIPRPAQHELDTRQKTTKQAEKLPTTHVNAVPIVEPLVITSHPFEAQPVRPSQVTVQAAVAQFSVAQGFLGYTQVQASHKPSIQETSPAPQEIEQLHNQLQQIMAQIASVQTSLTTTPLGVSSQEPVVLSQAPTTLPSAPRRLQVVKSWSVQKMTS